MHAESKTDLVEIGADALLDPVFQVDRDWRLTAANAALAALLGAPVERLIGGSLFAMFPELDGEHRPHLERAMHERRRIRVAAHHQPDRVLEHHVHARPGSTDGLTFLVLDVTEERREEARRSEEARSEAHAQLRDVLTTITDGYILLDHQFRFVEVNPAARRMVFLDRPLDELLGRPLWDLSPRGRDTDAFRQYQVAMRERRAVHFEAPSTLVDRWFEVHAYPREVGPTRELMLAIYLRDISERKRWEMALAASEREFRAVFELSGSGKALADPHSRIFVRVNDKFCRITGYSQPELLRLSPYDITHPDDVERDRAAHDTAILAGTDQWQHEKRYIRKDGQIVWVVVAGNVIRGANGVPRRTVAVIQDITERKLAEQALVEADRKKDEFLAMLAHELRNPLAPLRNAAAVLRKTRASDPQVSWSRELIERQVEHLGHLVDDLLDVSRITRGKIQLRPGDVELHAVLDQALETSRPAVEEGRHELVLEIDPEPIRVSGDVTRLVQVVSNLLNNAAKYTKEGGRITLALAREREHAVIRVKDTGVGIPPEMLPQIFEPFTQLDRSLDRSQGGLGIGLTLVRRIVELHGGAVEARSDGVGRGAELVVRLPVLVAPEVETKEPLAPAAAPAKVDGADRTSVRRVLVVDDNADSAESMAMLLVLAGHDVRTAPDGERALIIAREQRPELVLLDIGLPGMDGYEVARRLRASPETRGAKVVAMTGYGQSEDRRRSAEAGFDDHLVKPVDPDVIHALVS